MKRLAKSTKALSPVVASIILIAVTVAVSIAVAVWMGALTTGFMQTEQLSITSATIDSGTGKVTLALSNTGTTSVVVNQIWVGNVQIPSANVTTVMPVTLKANTQTTIALAANGYLNLGDNFIAGNNYQFKLVSAKGNSYTYTQIAP